MLENIEQSTNYKQSTKYKPNQKTSKINALEMRTLEFSKTVIRLCEKLAKTNVNNELMRQLIRSGTSIGANYREANEALSKKDFVHRLRIARKEAKETSYWLELVNEANPTMLTYITPIFQESRELRSILTSIIGKFNCFVFVSLTLYFVCNLFYVICTLT